MDTFLCSICKKCIPYLKLLYGTVWTVSIWEQNIWEQNTWEQNIWEQNIWEQNICQSQVWKPKVCAGSKVQATKIHGTKVGIIKSRNKGPAKVLPNSLWNKSPLGTQKSGE
jgi:hypothetical protein